jgi:general secretion pathway protein C
MIAMQTWFVRLPAIAEVALVLLAAWMVSGWLLPSEMADGNARPSSALQKSASLDMKLLLNSPLFGDAKKAAPVLKSQSVAPSRLRIQLLGTVVAGDKSAVVVALNGSKEQQVFFIGDAIKSGVTLESVEADAIVVDNQGKLERIELQEGKSFGAAPATFNKAAPRGDTVSRKVNRNMLNRQMQNFPQLLSQARVIPHFQDGKSDGFMLSEIVPDSLYAKVGLQNGDIIRKVNGMVINGPQQAMAMFQSLKDAVSIDVEIQRAGNVQQVHYDIQ